MTKGSNVINFLVVALLMFSIGFYMGGAGCGKQQGQDAKKEAKLEAAKQPNQQLKKDIKLAKPQEDRYAVPVGKSYFKGPANAPITIMEFSEFQCPFCSRVNPTMKKIMETYKDQVKIVFKHNPLPFHKEAMPAAEAALAAGKQGKFWEMHDKLFANQRALQRDKLEAYAKELGLNVEQFKKDLDTHAYTKDIKEDQANATKFGARGTPHFFVNGIRVKGAQPFAKFKEVIDKELVKALEIKKSGAADIYAEVIKNAKKKAEAPKRPQRKEDTNVYKVDTGDSPVKGNAKGALITVIEFSDYQCPFSKRAQGSVDQIVKEYGDKVRVYYRHNPLPFHKDAKLAAQAGYAAQLQGKYWDFHKKVFDNAKALKEDNLIAYAKELGLNVAKFTKDMKSPAAEAKVKKDMTTAQKFGSRGTPGFFINGRKIVGAQPFPNFKKLIDELLVTAQKSGKKGDALYAEVLKNGKDKADPPKPRKPQEDPNKVYDVPAGNSYWKGTKNAKVTIIEFSEFQCPFCSRVNPTIAKILDTYKGKVKVVFKHNPLPFHKDADLASQATLAAGEQGKFWEMHDKLFANQKALKRENLDKYAQELGLNMGKFKKALDSGAYKSAIQEDMKLAAKSGARGTPAFFINGKKLVGAQPYENFKKKIDEALKAK